MSSEKQHPLNHKSSAHGACPAAEGTRRNRSDQIRTHSLTAPPFPRPPQGMPPPPATLRAPASYMRRSHAPPRPNAHLLVHVCQVNHAGGAARRQRRLVAAQVRAGQVGREEELAACRLAAGKGLGDKAPGGGRGGGGATSEGGSEQEEGQNDGVPAWQGCGAGRARDMAWHGMPWPWLQGMPVVPAGHSGPPLLKTQHSVRIYIYRDGFASSPHPQVGSRPRGGCACMHAPLVAHGRRGRVQCRGTHHVTRSESHRSRRRKRITSCLLPVCGTLHMKAAPASAGLPALAPSVMPSTYLRAGGCAKPYVRNQTWSVMKATAPSRSLHAPTFGG